MNYTTAEFNIWPAVKSHTWKYRKRDANPKLIEMHAIRGDTTMELQDDSCRNWFKSANNRVRVEGGADWASMASRIIGAGGSHTIVMPDDYYPTWSAGHMDPIGISFELAQPPGHPPFTEACLDRAALEVAKCCLQYDIPPVVLPWVSGDNREAPGICRHDNSANGRKWGKDDPGWRFDDGGFEARVKAKILELQKPEPSRAVAGEMLVVYGILQAVVERNWGRVRDIAQAVIDRQR